MKQPSRTTRFRVLNEAGFKCHYCGRGSLDVVLEVDHVVPKSRGGTHRRSNLVAACFDCNRGKRDRDVLPPPDVWELVDERVQACGDCCVACGTYDITTLPVAMKCGDRWIQLRYRCWRGHEWTTGYDRTFAELHSAGTIEEGLRCFPSLEAIRTRHA